MAVSPYHKQPRRRFWSSAVLGRDIESVEGFYTPKFPIDGMKVATAGSCFAQEIARYMRKYGYPVVDKEPPPYGLRGEEAMKFGYGMYSARHGNIYTARQLTQLLKESQGHLRLDPDQIVWEKAGRYFDALRPNVEPDGLPSAKEVLLQRADHLRRFLSVIDDADLFVFTFGLTEAWMDALTGHIYPLAPGVIAGNYDPAAHVFKNFNFTEVYLDFREFRALAKDRNPDLKFLITVSPVPLAATADDAHVLTATVRSKAVLRAVAAELYDRFDDVDYFPSFDLLSTPFLGPSMFENDRRHVQRRGVAAVMKVFFDAHRGASQGDASPQAAPPAEPPIEDREAVQCEEALLAAFAERS